MRILGIDPGYGITGFGLIEAERNQFKLLHCGAITTPAGMDFSARLEIIYNDMVKSGLGEDKIRTAMEIRMKRDQKVESVSDLEKITGFTYFPNVPQAPKTTYNASDWGL